MQTSRIGRITPLMTWETIMMPKRSTFGMQQMAAEAIVMTVMMP